MTTRQIRAENPEVSLASWLAAFYKGLGDPTRVRIIRLLLEHGDMHVSQLIEELDMQQSRVSTQLACLRQCGFVISYRDGRNVYYTVADPRVEQLIQIGEEILSDGAERVLACRVVN